MPKHDVFRNRRQSGTGVEAQGSRGGGQEKGYEIDVKTVWDELRKALWTGFYL